MPGNVSIPISPIGPNNPAEMTIFLNSFFVILPTSIGSSTPSTPKISGCMERSTVMGASPNAVDKASFKNVPKSSN